MRHCPNCGDPWPPLTLHLCPDQPPPEPEALVDLLWNVLAEIEIPLGGIDISSQVAAVIARPLARRLAERADEFKEALSD